MKRHNLKGITFSFHKGDAEALRAPSVTFYRDTDAAPYLRTAAIAVFLVATEIYRTLDQRKRNWYVEADQGGPAIRFEMIDGLEAGGNAAHQMINEMEEILRESLALVGVPEHDPLNRAGWAGLKAMHERAQARKAAVP